MKKKVLTILLSLSFLLYTSNAYAIMDIMAKVQSVLEQVERYKKQAEQEIKEKYDLAKRARQGYETAKGCMANPLGCATSFALKYGPGLLKDGEIKGFPSITKIAGNILKKDPEGMDEDVRKTEHQRGGADSIKEVHKNRQENNAVTTANIAILFAKAAVTKQAIYQEGNDVYTREFDDTMESILKARAEVEMTSNYRISRILEMRAYMNSGAGVAGLTQHTRSIDDEE